jgi:hypothetical protein
VFLFSFFFRCLNVVYGFNQKRFRYISSDIISQNISYRMETERTDAKNSEAPSLIGRACDGEVEPLNVIKKWSTSLKKR